MLCSFVYFATIDMSIRRLLSPTTTEGMGLSVYGLCLQLNLSLQELQSFKRILNGKVDVIG